MKVAFLWDNFGPLHVDRVEAVQKSFAMDDNVIGIELFRKSSVYDWESETSESFEKFTLFAEGDWQSHAAATIAIRIISTCRENNVSALFTSHYEKQSIFIAAFLLRTFGVRSYMMACSKFDDQPRHVWREAIKSLALVPYKGALSSGDRPADYMRFLGIPADSIQTEYNTVSTSRIQGLSGVEAAPDGISFSERDFVIVSRLVEKKNISLAIEAYRLFRQAEQGTMRKLHICGSGPLFHELMSQALETGFGNEICFHGFLQTNDVAKLLGKALALILPSKEEQFGNVIPEAQALGVPCIVSLNCGARDRLIRQFVNGFLVEPDNPHGLSHTMQLLSANMGLWKNMCYAARSTSTRNDVSQFAKGVKRLLGV